MENKKELPHGWQVLADTIPHGQHNAITLNTIMDKVGISNKRTAYEIIEMLILKYDYVILANRKGSNIGYFIPANEDEYRNGVKPFKQSIKSMEKRAKALHNNFYKNNNYDNSRSYITKQLKKAGE